MRTLHLWNRQDLKDLARGVEFSFRVGDEVHVMRAEHAYKASVNGHGTGTDPAVANRPGNGHTTLSVAKKRAAARRALKSTAPAVAKEMGVSTTTIRAWIKQFGKP